MEVLTVFVYTSMFKVGTMGECLRVMLFFQCHFQVLFLFGLFFQAKKHLYIVGG